MVCRRAGLHAPWLCICGHLTSTAFEPRRKVLWSSRVIYLTFYFDAIPPLLTPVRSPTMGIYTHEEIYSRSMMRCGHGYAPWVPEPPAQLPQDYIRDGVNVCDILLLLSDGGYAYLFNCSLPKENPKNAHGVPVTYTPFHFDHDTDCNYREDRHTAGVPISSSGSQQFEINASTDVGYTLSYHCIMHLLIRTQFQFQWGRGRGCRHQPQILISVWSSPIPS
jgi:hypothetical protein